MKNISLACIAILMTCIVSFAHSGKHEDGVQLTKHFNKTLFALGDKGQVSFEILLDEKEYKIGKEVIGIVVHDSHDEDVEGARLEVTITTQQGKKESLTVKEKGGGLYLAPDTFIPKEGKWELGIVVRKTKIEDSATFVFPEAASPLMPAGKYDAGALKGKK